VALNRVTAGIGDISLFFGGFMKTQISIRLPAELLSQIEKMAKKESRERASMIRVLLKNAIRDSKK